MWGWNFFQATQDQTTFDFTSVGRRPTAGVFITGIELFVAKA